MQRDLKFYGKRSWAVRLAPVFLAMITPLAQAARLTDGYVARSSFDAGETIDLYLSGPEEQDARLGIYSVGSAAYDYITVDLAPQTPPAEEPWMGYDYEVTHQYPTPADMRSGVYRMRGGVRFVIRDPDRTSDVVVVHPTNTINAYSKSGDVNLYGANKSQTVAVNRPMKETDGTARFDDWLASTQHDYRYLADYDLEDYSQLEGSKVMILTGAAEYWTRNMRENFDRFINEGGHVLVFAGNTMHRPVEFDETGQFMTELRETPRWKGTWDDEYLDYPTVESIAGDFHWGGYGWHDGDRADFGWDGWKVIDEGAPFLEGVDLSNGDIIPNPTNEYDAPPIHGFDENGIPMIDNDTLGLHYINLVGFDRAWSNFRGTDGYGGWYEFQRTPESGRVIVVGSTQWTRNAQPIAKEVNNAMINYLLDWDGGYDYNHDGLIDASDIDFLTRRITSGSHDPLYDINGDGSINAQDHETYVAEHLNSRPGDANLDGVFTSRDLTMVFAAGLYRDEGGLATWQSGDWNGDRRFDSNDLVAAMIVGDYESVDPAQAVPEPSGWHALLALALIVKRRR